MRILIFIIGLVVGYSWGGSCHAQALFPPQNPWSQPPSQVVNISNAQGTPLGTATTYGNTTYYTNAAGKPLGYTQSTPTPQAAQPYYLPPPLPLPRSYK